MDTKQLQGLDPKLQEAYHRVMATTPLSAVSVNANLSQTPSVNKESIPSMNTPSGTVVKEKIVTTTPHPTETTQPLPAPSHPQNAGTVHVEYQLRSPHLAKQKGKMHIPIGVYVLGGAVFFILYTLFWVRVFNINVPFLP